MLNDIKHILKNPIMIISMLAIATIPIIYTAIFLGSMWDPYDKMDQLVINVVNEDAGATIDGEEKNLGQDMVDELQNNEEFKWQFTDTATAESELEKGEAYALVKIPQDASAEAGTLLEEAPQNIEIEVETNPGYNFLGSVMGSSAGTAIQDELGTTVTEIYTKSLMDGLSQAEESNQEMTGALSEMQSSVDELISGNESVQGGIEQAVPGSPNQLSQGNAQVTDGLNSLSENLNQMIQQSESGSESFEDMALEQENAEFISDPVNMSETEVTDIENYGQSFAPFIIAVSLFVCSIAFGVIFPLNRAGDNYRNGFSMAVSKSLVIVIHSIISSVILFGVLMLGFDMTVAEPGQFYLLTLLWSLAAMTMVSLLISLLGNVGKFISIVLLILQLSSGAGTFPIQTADNLYQVLHPLLPMSYVITALREAIFDFKAVLSTSDTLIYMISIIVIGLLIFGAVNMLKFRYRKFENVTREMTKVEY